MGTHTENEKALRNLDRAMGGAPSALAQTDYLQMARWEPGDPIVLAYRAGAPPPGRPSSIVLQAPQFPAVVIAAYVRSPGETWKLIMPCLPAEVRSHEFLEELTYQCRIHLLLAATRLVVGPTEFRRNIGAQIASFRGGRG